MQHMEDLIRLEDDFLVSIAEGNEQAFERLFNTYKHKVYTTAMLFTKNETDAEEIVQDVFSRIWRYRTKLPDVNNLPAWIMTVTRNRSLTILKKIATEQRQRQIMPYRPDRTSLIDTEFGIRQKELHFLLQSALKRLTPQQRTIFELSRLEGLDRKTVAASLGLSPATVSVHLTIALKRVRTFLYEYNYELIFLYFFFAFF